jgi:hypothetical protein
MKRGKVLVKMVGFHLSVKEYEEFEQAYKQTMYRSKSEYGRKMLLGKPVTTIYRNRSLDDFIESSVQIRNELKKISAMDVFTPAEKEDFKIKVNDVVGSLIKMIEQCAQK